jgi:hypothetical protein
VGPTRLVAWMGLCGLLAVLVVGWLAVLGMGRRMALLGPGLGGILPGLGLVLGLERLVPRLELFGL